MIKLYIIFFNLKTRLTKTPFPVNAFWREQFHILAPKISSALKRKVTRIRIYKVLVLAAFHCCSNCAQTPKYSGRFMIRLFMVRLFMVRLFQLNGQMSKSFPFWFFYSPLSHIWLNTECAVIKGPEILYIWNFCTMQ